MTAEQTFPTCARQSLVQADSGDMELVDIEEHGDGLAAAGPRRSGRPRLRDVQPRLKRTLSFADRITRKSALPPGPSAPRVAQALQWGFHYPQFTQRAHARYGPTFTVRIGGLPTAVVTIDREAIRRLFTGDQLVKRHANDHLRPLFGARALAVLEPDEHLARRRLLLPPFHRESVRAHAQLMDSLVERELDRWRQDEPIAVLPLAQQLTLDVILQAVLGISDETMRASVRGVFDAMESLPGSAIAGYFPRLGARARWNLPAERYWRLRDEFDRTLMAQIAITRASPNIEGRGDILAMLATAHDEDGNGLDDEDLRDELKTLIAAGHETTASAIAWGVELLAHDPEVLARTRAALETGEDAYIDGMVKEVLRMRPPVPLAATRHVLVPFTIGDYTIDPPTVIAVNAYGLHHDPELYPEPGRMRPERFIEGGPDTHTFLPFGGGAHRCLGAALAQLELKIALTAIARRFEFIPEDRALAPPVRRGITLVPKGGARVRVHAR
jgi:cytochrome P450 family 135